MLGTSIEMGTNTLPDFLERTGGFNTARDNNQKIFDPAEHNFETSNNGGKSD